MASKSKVLKKFLISVLFILIFSGVGFVGFYYFSGSNSEMILSSVGLSKDASSSENKDSGNQSIHGNMNMSESSSKHTMNMEESTSKNTMNSQYLSPVISAVLQNKEDLEKGLFNLKESLSLIILEPSQHITNQANDKNVTDTQMIGNNGQKETTDTQGNIVVNVFPKNTTNSVPTMNNMGLTYDANKMDQLHSSQYKVAVGIQLLEQLKNNLSVQLEQANLDVTNPSQYYYNHYLTTVQNKHQLTNILTYINEISTLVNINPFISPEGLVYDNEKMKQVHDGIKKLAEAVVRLNIINDNLNRQALEFSQLTQSHNQSMSSMNMNENVSNFNLINVLYILVIVFILMLLISIFGSIGSLLKSSTQKSNHK